MADESNGCHQHCRIDRLPHRAGHAEHRALRRPGQIGPHCAGVSGGHLHGAIQLFDRPKPRASRHRRQRLVRPRFGGSAVLEAIQSPGGGTENLGANAAGRSEIHLRAIVLVVQHVFHRRLFDHSAARLSGRWPQGVRHLCLAGEHPPGDQAGFGGVPVPGVLGSRRRRQDSARRGGCGVALDCGIGQMDRKPPLAHAEPDLPAASGL